MRERRLELYFDLDEVIYDLSGIVVSIYNKDFNDNFNIRDNNSYWWEDAPKADKDYFEKLLQRKGIFLDGRPVDGMVELVDNLKQIGYDIYFVTKPQYEGSCYIEKCKFLRKYFDWIDLDKHLIATGNKGLLAKEYRVLIDDSPENLRSWSNKSGIAIGFGDYGWTKEFKGLRVSKACELYNLINLMERGAGDGVSHQWPRM